MTRKEIADQCFEKLGFCGCGNPEGVLGLLYDCLKDIRAREAEQNSGLSESMKDRIGSSEMVNWVLYWLDSHDLTEHGGSVSRSWLTKDGEDLLESIEALGDEGIVGIFED